jgi:hypothetical protein
MAGLKSRYEAPRYWLPEGQEIPVIDSGFMPDRQGPLAAVLPDAKSLVELADTSCLVLIGEPGLGKSTAMKAEYKRIAASLLPEDRAQLVELGFTRVAAELRREIFESSAFREWREGDGRLFLFLDSLDEARMRIEHVAKLLLGGLEGVPFGRLVVRLSCRSADRHSNLEAELQQRFGTERFEVRELAPLTRPAVAAAARSWELEDESFVDEVIAKELQPLAMVPESLKFLLSVVKESGSLPERRVDAFEEGLVLLAREPDEDRRDGETAGRLSASERIAICARVAASLTLSGRSAIRIDEGRSGPDEASLAELTGGREVDHHVAAERQIDIDERALKEALGTAILTAAGAQKRLGFAQASYAEFLTARWLADGGLSAKQRQVLLFSSVGDKVVPQLHEVATWLASLSAEFHRELLVRDPLVLLRSEPGGLDDSERALVIDALFAGVRSLEIDRWDRPTRKNYAALTHPEIGAQLRAVIFDESEDLRAREVACDVVAACEVDALGDELAGLAVDSAVDLELRVAALSALSKFATREQRRRFVGLASVDQVEDVDDELKGAALRVLWPEILSAEELLSCLTRPKRPRLLGGYRMFVLNEITPHLHVNQLPAALRWSAKLPVTHFATDELGTLREELLVVAWPLITEDSDIREAYLTVIVGLLATNGNLLSTSLREQHPEVLVEAKARRTLIEGLIARLADGTLSLANLLFSVPRLLIGEDMDWLVEELGRAVGSDRERPLAELVDRLPILGGSEFRVLEAREESPVLRELSAERFEPVQLASPLAAEARRIYEMRLGLERDDDEGSEEDLDVPGHVSGALDSFEEGNLDGFWIATRWLEINGKRESESFISDLRALTGWSLIAERDRQRLLSAIPRYLSEAEPEPQRWFGKGTIYWPAWAAYRGLRALADLDQSLIETLGDAVWKRWAPVIINWPRESMGETGEPEFNEAMLEALFARVPGEASSWVAKLLDRELRSEHGPFVLHRLGEVWDPALEEVILKRAKRSHLDPRKRTEVLRFLIDKGSAAALAHARRLVTARTVAGGGRARVLALRVAAMLVAEGGGSEWERAWRLIEADEDFGRELIEALAETETQIPANLSAEKAGELYLWVEARYPAREDPRVEGAHHPTAREEVGRWRGRIAGVIAAQGTRDAVTVLGRLTKELPEHVGLRRYKRDAEEILERSEWEPPRPEDVIRLSEDSRRRYVRSDKDLRTVLIGSLERAQVRLGGQMAQAAYLWDSEPLHPKSERLVGAWLEEHLRTDLAGSGIFVGRELEIRANARGYMGESVDIFTEAVAGEQVQGSQLVRVVTELKCCWHADLDTAMRDQLVSRYLDAKNNQGIYLVAYFDSPKWDDSDTAKRARCRRRSVAELREFFAQQAAEVNAEGLAEVSTLVLDCSVRTAKERAASDVRSAAQTTASAKVKR